MSRVTAALQRIGGPASVTWWTFVLSTADRLIASSLTQSGIALAPISVRLPAVLAAQVPMFVPLVLLWLLQRRQPRARPVLTIATFVVAVVLRAWALDFILHLWAGTPQVLAQRIAASAYTTLLILVATSYVANALRERREELERLHALGEQLEQSRADAERSVLSRNDDLVRHVQAILIEEIDTVESQRASEAADSLRRIAQEVVRPLSHGLAKALAERRVQSNPSPVPHLRWRFVIEGAALERPFRPVLTALAISGSLMTVALVIPGVTFTVLTGVGAIAVVLAAGNSVLARVNTGRGVGVRLASVAAVAIASGLLTGTFLRILIGPSAWSTTLAQASVYYVTVVSIAIALASAVLVSRDDLLGRLSTSTDELRRQLVSTRQLSWFHRRALARALHGPVQSAVEAAAIRLASDLRAGGTVVSTVSDLREQLTGSLDFLNRSEATGLTLESGLARVSATWDGLCTVTVHVESSTTSALDQDSIARACALDIVTEAVSNAVRHGKAQTIEVSMRSVDGDVIIEVIDDGDGRVGQSSTGLGSSFLDECTLTWSLREEPRGHRLTAAIPIKAVQ